MLRARARAVLAVVPVLGKHPVSMNYRYYCLLLLASRPIPEELHGPSERVSGYTPWRECKLSRNVMDYL